VQHSTEESERTTATIPLWACFLIVAGLTFSAFWFFCGQHYVAHRCDIDYGLFHHEEDNTNPLSWLAWFIQTGTLSGFTAFVVSTVTVIGINRRTSKRDNSEISNKSPL
jgi:hypothetical protein